MRTYHVKKRWVERHNCDELYQIKAETEQDAIKNYHKGKKIGRGLRIKTDAEFLEVESDEGTSFSRYT